MELSKKEQLFVSEYLKCFNATEAYMKLHPRSKRESAWANASRLIGSDKVKDEIKARLAEVHLSSDEALAILAEHARGDLGDFTNDYGSVDWTTARQKGLTKLVKKWKVKTVTINGKDEDKEITTEEIELHDPQSAIEKILRVQGKLKGDAPTINLIKGYGEWTPDDWDKEKPKSDSKP